MKKRGLLILLPALLLLAVASLLEDGRLIRHLSDYLSKSERVQANILIVEGWLPDFALLKSGEEFRKNGYDRIITTGIDTYTPYFNMHSNGSLIFNTGSSFSGAGTSASHTICTDAYGEPGGSGPAHFIVSINDKPAGDFFAGRRKKEYCITWNGRLDRIDSIAVRFDNDKMDDSGDRNLYIRSISADHKIVVPYLNNSVYEIEKEGGDIRLVSNFASGSGSAKIRLAVAGIDSALITAVPARKVIMNRTLTSALAFREWLKSNHIEIKGINIISMGPHARRTWMTYNKVLGGQYRIGIISVPDNTSRNTPVRMTMKTLREALALLYYKIVLIPYRHQKA